MELLEWVASSREVWGGRDLSGSVVSYLDISLSRLRSECDIGGFEAPIDELCSTFPTGYETSGPVGLVDPAQSLAPAIRDSRVVAFYLSEFFLWYFPPGSQCSDDDGVDIVRGQRF